MMAFELDGDTVEQTEKDGIKIIHNMEFDDENLAACINTTKIESCLKIWLSN